MSSAVRRFTSSTAAARAAMRCPLHEAHRQPGDYRLQRQLRRQRSPRLDLPPRYCSAERLRDDEIASASAARSFARPAD